MAGREEEGPLNPGGPVAERTPDIDSEANRSQEGARTPSPPSSKSYDRVILMLKKAKSDTEKFAALLMVTKLIKAEGVEEGGKKMLLDAIGLTFLSRLLRTRDIIDGCPPSVFQSIALTILTSLLTPLTSHQGTPALQNLIPTLIEIATSMDQQELDPMLVKDAFQCLRIIVKEEKGRLGVIDAEGVGLLVESYTNNDSHAEDSLDIIMALVCEEGQQTWDKELHAFDKLITNIAREFAGNHDTHKFLLCSHLTHLLQSVPHSATEQGEQEWKEDLHRGLSDIILSKLDQERRMQGLRLAGVAMEILGVPWVLQIDAKVSQGQKTRARQLLLMMVHLSCIEVRMCLEDREFEQAISFASPTTACYTILETAIIFLVNGAVDFEQKQKEQLYAALKGAFNAILTFLQDPSVENAELQDPRSLMFICATIRVLCAWLAEETEANREGVYKTLPFILKICKHTFDHNKKLSMPKKKAEFKQWINVEGKDQLPDILRFLLPGLCHLTAEDVPRAILLELQLETLLFDYLTFHWNNIKDIFGKGKKEGGVQIENKMPSSTEAIGTISNIFMNIVVQEQERVKANIFYYTLLKFIFTKVPDIPPEEPHLKLSGNLCILGLMILRHQHPNVKSTDFTIFRFIQSTVRFLWDAHNIEESQDYSTLVVSSKYLNHWDTLMDLWFLGMHTLTLVLLHIPWLTDFLLESEWPQTLTSTLGLVREGGLDAGLRGALEEFLSLLARTSKPAYRTLQERGIEQVCRNHKLQELSAVYNVKL